MSNDLTHARGRVLSAQEGRIVFSPNGQNYELHLIGTYSGPIGAVVSAKIFLTVRKMMTVATGGAFIAPVLGTPKTVQGRLQSIEGGVALVHAGCPLYLRLPADEHAIDFSDGSFQVGQLVNAICLPGASFELVGATAAVAAV